jgi:hypothetical protein
MEDRYLAEIQRNKSEVEGVLPNYYEAGEYQRVIELFEGTRSLSKPVDLRKIRTESRMAYVLCVHHLGLGYDADEVREANHRLLARWVPEWLGSGLYASAAQWMKLAHWNEQNSREGAWRALRRVYDYLPGVTMPTD